MSPETPSPGSPSSASPPSGRGRRIVITVFILFTVGAGCTFVFKLHEFLSTIRRQELDGFAFDPILIYGTVAIGFTLLLCWAFLTGQFSHIEQPKFDMLERQREIDALERGATDRRMSR